MFRIKLSPLVSQVCNYRSNGSVPLKPSATTRAEATVRIRVAKNHTDPQLWPRSRLARLIWNISRLPSVGHIVNRLCVLLRGTPKSYPENFK